MAIRGDESGRTREVIERDLWTHKGQEQEVHPFNNRSHQLNSRIQIFHWKKVASTAVHQGLVPTIAIVSH